MGGVPGPEWEGDIVVEFEFLGSDKVFRLTAGVDGESAKDTRLEELSAARGTRMGARSTRAELRRTAVVAQDAALRRCLSEGRGFLISDVSEAVNDAGRSHRNQMARRLTAKPKEPMARAEKKTRTEV